MKFSISNLDFKKYCDYSDKEIAKAYVLYAIDCERILDPREWDDFVHDVLKFTLRKNRIKVSKLWRQDKTIYFVGKQSHGCGYSWDTEILHALYPLLNPLKSIAD